MQRFEPYWELLLSYLVMFGFVYPSERHRLPRDTMATLLARVNSNLESPAEQDRVCRGTLMSRGQYLLDIGQYGYHDARIAPRGNMTPEDGIYWTWAITHVE